MAISDIKSIHTQFQIKTLKCTIFILKLLYLYMPAHSAHITSDNCNIILWSDWLLASTSQSYDSDLLLETGNNITPTKLDCFPAKSIAATIFMMEPLWHLSCDISLRCAWCLKITSLLEYWNRRIRVHPVALWESTHFILKYSSLRHGWTFT